tara:strand:+ start:145 stop:678 length:534 start_codon:yes stop_codon:yes gene_type:complete
MIIQCTACEKKFTVPDAAITANGRLVQCSSCKNQWTQYPIKPKKDLVKQFSPTKNISVKKAKKKKTGPAPYSKEYMQQKWGTSVQEYSLGKGISNKTKNLNKKNKKQKKISTKVIEKPGFGFFNYLITFGVLFTFFVGILSFERTRLSRKFPFLEPYINHFFETIDNFKILILDFYK